MTWRERWQELKRIYGGEQREVRSVAISWQPDPRYQEDCTAPCDKPREFFIVLREAPRKQDKQP
jgi:hypothetical protein